LRFVVRERLRDPEPGVMVCLVDQVAIDDLGQKTLGLAAREILDGFLQARKGLVALRS
jgi:hypothetical protein